MQTSLARLDALARHGAVIETRHGVTIEDPYRGLESDSPQTRAWIEAQVELTERVLSRWSRPETAQRLRALLSTGSLGHVAVGGGRVFYTKRAAGREQAALFVAGRPEPIVDPEARDGDGRPRWSERAAIDWFYPSPRGRYVAFGISANGDERSTLYVLEVETGRLLDDRIERTKWASVEWEPDERGFYYTRYPAPGEPDFDADAPESYWPRVFHHRLGTDPASDPVVHGGRQRTDFPSMQLSEDGRWLVLTTFRGWSASDVHLFDRGAAGAARRLLAPDASRPLRAVVEGLENLTSGLVHRGLLYLHTNIDAPRYRIATVAPAAASDRARWRDLVPESDGPIEDWVIARDRLVVHTIEDVRSRLRVYTLDGRPLADVPLPAAGSVGSLAGEPDSSVVAFTFQSYLVPPTLYAYEVRTGRLELLDRIDPAMDLSPFVEERASVRSADGTEIPVTVVRRRDARPDGTHRVLATGYGGFNVSLLPAFSRQALYWLERSGIYVVANLRGGGERGESWHRAGNLENKERVFEDFEAVLRWLGGPGGWSQPARIAITGASNGGLLVGAMITRCPDAFGAAIGYVGLYDMLRYDRFPPAELWVTEYGDPDDPRAFAWLRRYSPYHNVPERARLPAVLLETGDHDTRVHGSHTAKFTARLQAAAAGRVPILYYVERRVGHGAGTRLEDLVRRHERAFTFLEGVLDRP
ncbi:MAG: prolyl oligopeptidase family serine peptidase [Myxococcales bacterium]|nr:prolyl oligopeptidase family serine peptidase [Myxococcales bacterium]